MGKEPGIIKELDLMDTPEDVLQIVLFDQLVCSHIAEDVNIYYTE